MDANLTPAPHPVGIFPFYTQHTQPIALRIREHKFSLSGDDFTIKDAATDQPVFQVNGKAISLHGKKEIYDVAGKHLLTLQKEHLHIHTTFKGIDPASGSELVTIKSGFSLGTKLTATYHNPQTGSAEELLLKGDFFDRKAEITLNGTPVARISRKFLNFGELFADKQTYLLAVAPGVDACLLAAFCIALDEKANETKGGGGDGGGG